MIKKEIFFLSPFLLFYLLITFFVSGNSFFWDTIQLGSKQAHWFYDNNFRYFFLPNEIDSGHPPPLFGIYLALVWKIFGRNLEASHFAMLPFLWGIVIQSYLLLKRFFKPEYVPFILVLFLADPTLLAQSILISPDIVLIFFFLLSLNAILSDKKVLLAVALIFIGLISMRGMMHVVILYILSLMIALLIKKDFSFKKLVFLSMPFVPVVLLVSLFLLMHFLEKGWIGYHENSPWKGSFELVDVKGFLRNIIILGWRLGDFGRIIIWIIGLPILWISFRKKMLTDKSIILLSLFLIALFVLTPNMLLHKNLLGHRYLLILYLSFALLIFYQSSLLRVFLLKKLSVAACLILMAGNFLAYPDTISPGWDASLGHYPYYSMRKEIINFMEKNEIPFEKTGSGFPNISSFRYIDLYEHHTPFIEKDLLNNDYVFYSMSLMIFQMRKQRH